MTVSVGSVGLEDGTISPVAGSAGVPEDGELDAAVSELVGSGPSDFVFGLDDGGLDDGDGVGRGSVITGHFSVELADGTVEGDVSELLVHVVVSSSGLIPQDNAEGLDVIGSSFEDFVDGQDLSLGSLGLELTTEMVPELGLGNDFVASEQSDSIYFGVGVLLSGSFATEDEILTNLSVFEIGTFICMEGSVGS